MGFSNAERQARWRARQAEAMEALRKAAESPHAAPTSPELLEARRELDQLRQHVRDLEARRPSKPPAATKPTPDPDSAVARLTAANKTLRAKLSRMKKFYEAESDKKGIMSFETYSKVQKCLHPDSTPTRDQRNEACGLFSQWKNAARRRRH